MANQAKISGLIETVRTNGIIPHKYFENGDCCVLGHMLQSIGVPVESWSEMKQLRAYSQLEEDIQDKVEQAYGLTKQEVQRLQDTNDNNGENGVLALLSAMIQGGQNL